MKKETEKFWFEEEKKIVKKEFQGPSLLDIISHWINNREVLDNFEKIDTSSDRISDSSEKREAKLKFSFFNYSPFVLALIGQICFVIGDSFVFVGGILYSIAIGLLINFLIRKKTEIEDTKESVIQKDDLYFRLIPFVISLAMLVFTFIKFSNNTFTLLNILLWISSLIFMIISFWENNDYFGKIKIAFNTWKGSRHFFYRNKHFLSSIAVFLIIIFFQFFRLSSVLPEMISDHAEKLLDVMDIFNGQSRIFFPRNTGREPLQFYLIALTIKIFNTGFSYLSLKIGTAIFSVIMCVYVYLIGKELDNKWVGLLAALLAGVSFWGNVLSRVALRFILYPAFVAPTLYYFIKGLRTGKRNYFIFAGILLGIGLNGYSPIRVLPILLVIGFALYCVHKQSKGFRYQAFVGLVLTALFSFILFLPLARYFVDNPHSFLFRQSTRLTSIETSIEGSPWFIFLKNSIDALFMFNLDAGEIWVNSLPHKPLLDIVTAAFFVIGLVTVIYRYLKYKNWIDIFLLVSIPILILPSTLSIAYPAENPAPNRAGGAMVVVFYFAAIGIYIFLKLCLNSFKDQKQFSTTIIGIVLLSIVLLLNYNMMFVQHNTMYKNNAWNSSEMGEVLSDYLYDGVRAGDVHIVAYPHWVDGRLVGFNAGLPGLDLSISSEMIPLLSATDNRQVFLVKPEDQYAIELLQDTYPYGELSIHESFSHHKDFYVFVTR